MRLDQFISQASGLSRSHTQHLIRQGVVTVDEVMIKNPSQHIQMTSSVLLEHQQVTLPQPLYLMLNKPQGVLSATTDPHQRTVLDLIDHPHKHTLHVVGRLDKDTTGLLLLTNNGQWSHRLMSPRQHLGKTYDVTLAEPLAETALMQFKAGIQLKGEKRPCQPAEAELIQPTQLRLTIYEGMYHQVKRMLAMVDNRVIALHRQCIGKLSLDTHLAQGHWRSLRPDELVLL